MVQWGYLGHWHTDTLTHWYTDTLAHWQTVTLTYQHTNKLPHWQTNTLTHWHTDTLTYQHTETLTHWHTSDFSSSSSSSSFFSSYSYSSSYSTYFDIQLPQGRLSCSQRGHSFSVVGTKHDQHTHKQTDRRTVWKLGVTPQPLWGQEKCQYYGMKGKCLIEKLYFNIIVFSY